MKQRKYVAGLNMDRLRTIHDLIDRLVPVAPLTPEVVANLKKAAVACGAEISGVGADTKKTVTGMLREMTDDRESGFFDIPDAESKAARLKLKKLLNPNHGKRRGFIK
jgi:hypothetical protein